MPFKKGQVANPNGRPPKGRAIADKIESAFAKTYQLADGKRRNGASILADVLVNAALYGEVELLNKKKLELSPKEWADFVKWLAVHIDGPVKAELDLTSAGEKLGPTVVLFKDAEEDTDPPAPASDAISS